MVDTTIVTRGPKAADYFKSAAFPDKIATTGHFVSVWEDGGNPFMNWSVHLSEAYAPAKDIMLQIAWLSVSVIVNAIVIRAEYEKLVPGGNALTADNFGTLKEETSVVNGTIATLTIEEITLTPADMGSPAAGDWGRLRLTRRTSDAADTLVGDALFYGWTMKQLGA